MPLYRIPIAKTPDVQAWQWFPDGHPLHPDLPEEFDVIEHPDGSCLVARGEARERIEHRAEPGDWIAWDPTFGLRTVTAASFTRDYRPVEAEDAIAEGPQGPAGHRLAHERAAQIVGRLVGALHAEQARYDVDADCHRLVAYLDYLADQVGHARRLLGPLVRLREALEPYLQAAADDAHQSDLLEGEIAVPWGEGLAEVDFSCRLRDLEDARRLFAEPVPLSGTPEPGPEVPPGKPYVPHKAYPTADLSGVQPDPDQDDTIACPDCGDTQRRVPGQAEYECDGCTCTFTDDETPEPEEGDA